MIDMHTHPCDLLDQKIRMDFEASGEIPSQVLATFVRAVEGAERVVVLPLWAPECHIEVSNAFVAAVVRHDPARFVGFANVNPASPDAISQLEYTVQEYGVRGLKLAPIYQQFTPDDEALWPFYARVQELGLPILWHQGTSNMAPTGSLDDARPVRLDRVATSFPGIKMVIAHFGYPWYGDVLALLRKCANVYTDVSVLGDRQWYLYNAMIGAMEYHATDKILFGSDYPGFTTLEMADAFLRLPSIGRGAGLPHVPEDLVEEIIERDSLSLLGIE